MKVLALSMLVLVLINGTSTAQEVPLPRISPLALATAHIKDTYLKITYGQPQKKGRTIFGGLVPYGQVWRTGANEATEITLTRDVKINTRLLKAGTYALFTIPGKDAWTILFNSDLGQWGAYNYNPKSDIMRFEVPVGMTPEARVYEAFTIRLDQQGESIVCGLMWDTTRVQFTIELTESKP